MRYRRRQVSLSSKDTATPVDRSGGYSASSTITFSQSAPAEPVERIDTSGLPAVGDDATIPRDAPKRPIADVRLPEPPVAAEETIELMAFMEAADESKRQGGRPVKLAEVLEKARAEAKVVR